MAFFDYDNAEKDILEAGGDPDYLSHFNEDRRDDFLEKMGLDPEDYGSKSDGGFSFFHK